MAQGGLLSTAGDELDEFLMSSGLWSNNCALFCDFSVTGLEQLPDEFNIFSQTDQHTSSSATVATRETRARQTSQSERRSRTREDGKLKRLERNRRAQARYRQRQKEMYENVELRFDEACAKLQQAKSEQNSLAFRNDLFAKMLSVKDSSIDMLESARDDAELEQPRGSNPRPSNDTAVGAASTDFGQPNLEVQVACSSLNWSLFRSGSEGSKAGSGPCLLEGSREGRSAHSHATNYTSTTEDVPSVLLPHCSERYLPLTAKPSGLCASVDSSELDCVQSCTPEAFVKEWNMYALLAKDVLDEYDITHKEEILVRLRPIMEREALHFALTLQHNRQCILQVLSSSFEEGTPQAQVQEKYDAIARALRITPAQKAQQEALFDSFKKRLQRLRKERDGVVDRIKRASSGNFLSVGGFQKMVQHHMAVAEEASLLRHYPEKELSAFLELTIGWGRIFTPLQRARGASMSYPCFPDLIQLMQALERLELD